MASVARLPNIRDLAQDFYAKQYAEEACWRLVHELLQAGGFLDVDADPLEAVKSVRQVWWQDDPRDPFTLVQPWDWFLMRREHPWVNHPALVVDSMELIHVHKAGVRIEPMRRYRHRLMQLARLRCLW